MIGYPHVGVYDEAHWLLNVHFKHKWQARLFHWLLNHSLFHNGTREY